MSDTEKGKFLVVDDCSINRMVIKILLEKNGYYVEEAEDGMDVINLIKGDEIFDIIWIDMEMPIIGGVECTKILRGKYNYDGVIVGITSHADELSIEQCIKSGMNDVIIKPIKEETIIGFANKYLNN